MQDPVQMFQLMKFLDLYFLLFSVASQTTDLSLVSSTLTSEPTTTVSVTNTIALVTTTKQQKTTKATKTTKTRTKTSLLRTLSATVLPTVGLEDYPTSSSTSKTTTRRSRTTVSPVTDEQSTTSKRTTTRRGTLTTNVLNSTTSVKTTQAIPTANESPVVVIPTINTIPLPTIVTLPLPTIVTLPPIQSTTRPTIQPTIQPIKTTRVETSRSEPTMVDTTRPVNFPTNVVTSLPMTTSIKTDLPIFEPEPTSAPVVNDVAVLIDANRNIDNAPPSLANTDGGDPGVPVSAQHSLMNPHGGKTNIDPVAAGLGGDPTAPKLQSQGNLEAVFSPAKLLLSLLLVL